jgi:hypothetical protein
MYLFHGGGTSYKSKILSKIFGGAMASKFYVVGGEYADSSFTTLAGGQAEQLHGPFEENEARSVWRSLTGKTVDNALIRYRIRPEAEVIGASWYVAGGEYSDSHFLHLAPDAKLESYGPFPRPEAVAVWRALTGKTVDNAMVRYDIVTAEDLENMKKIKG